jgi:hypothetical protein
MNRYKRYCEKVVRETENDGVIKMERKIKKGKLEKYSDVTKEIKRVSRHG